MMPLSRRTLVAAAGTVAAAMPLRKLKAGGLQDISVLQKLDTPEPIEAAFTLADGTARSLADYAGRGVVLNLWATWCIPCVAEMPSLDAFARAVADYGIDVLPLSSDRGGAPVVQGFFSDHGIKTLPVLLDPHSAVVHALHVRGVPTTFIIDRSGQKVAWLEGTADWSSDAATAAIRGLVGTNPPRRTPPDRA